MKRERWVLRGRVQGIGFRWFVREQAGEIGVSGWVRNRPDGSVEIEAQGEEEGLEMFLGAVRTRHPSAEVAAVERRLLAARQGAEDFEIR